ncbi:hypothetical protein [Amycolatopsis australiensis]|uniref:Uncharacterized protein n=1 Tax=Amycolatopsis australiensis TaxID=546364 RepID=A0A1K1RSA8_9PSEU|nr:hypothetical protein [Amycolatopsis australiensis]SFW74660.1 hypothetical protein SAMN04489730_3809 [Amycolatopsis australiensis]
MTARRHAAPAPPTPGTRSRPVPTTRGHIARLVGAAAAFLAILGGGVLVAVVLAQTYVTHLIP